MILCKSKYINIFLFAIITPLSLFGAFSLINLLSMHSYSKEYCSTICTFSDVAGAIPPEIENLVGTINNPEIFNRLGAQKPKGILLVGPPGTGKTLLVRALAGETESGFLYKCGSEFIELYAGNGAKKVRELFSKARKLLETHTSVIIFIDELDALGNRETECFELRQTINQLLTCMDGFEQNEHIIVIGATNKPEIVDKALKRSGRFDHIIEINLPDKQTRLAILQLYCKECICASGVNLEKIAKETSYFSGADLKLLVNQAATHAAQEKSAYIEQQHFESALKNIKQKKQHE